MRLAEHNSVAEDCDEKNKCGGCRTQHPVWLDGVECGVLEGTTIGIILMAAENAGVYGDWDGDWVDEDSPTKPVDQGALARLDAEKAWISLGQCMDIPVQVFRLGGIYGPGRSALDTIIKQQKLSRSQKTRGSKLYTSRIHVADICQAILASIELPSSGKIYNVVDDDAASRAEVFSFAKSLLEEKWPCKQWKAIEKETPTGNTEGEVSGYRIIAEKRVSNRRLKDELQVKMIYPSYISGLKSIIESIDSCPF